jgi:isoquinoline 1-oxidoreductase
MKATQEAGMASEPDNFELDEVERYEMRETGLYRFHANRREFVQVVGAGLVIAVSADVAHAQRPGGKGGQRTARRAEKLSERFHIDDYGHVTLFTSKVEAGQGSRTQLTQAVAEELRLPVDYVQVVMADTELCPDDGGTAGSRTTPSTVPRVRNAAAALYEKLANFAAERLGVDRAGLKIEDGTFSSGSNQLTLARLAKDDSLAAFLNVPPPENVALTAVDKWQVLGKSTPKVGGEHVVTGAAKYPSDIVRPDMLYGKVLRPASYNATLTSIDLASAKAMAGVVVVHDGNFVGCAAATSWQAAKAIEALSATAVWQPPEREYPSSERCSPN